MSASAVGTQNVIVYCAQDQVYAEPIFQRFEKQTGIKVRALYDNEAVKTVGLANRLMAERAHPVCDVFWGNEEMRTRQLALHNVFRVTNAWAAFGHRSRRLVVNTNFFNASSEIHSLMELTNSQWLGRLAFAYPQFGTTAAHFHALRQFWGEPVWESWCRGLVANKAMLLDGNSEVVKAVARGDAKIGLTDSDDIADGQREGLPVAALPMNREMLLIPNTVAVIRGAPHPEPADRLFAYLQSPAVILTLIKARALEAAAPAASEALDVDWTKVLQNLEVTTAELNRLFLK